MTASYRSARRRARLALETLERRDAPATLVSATKLTYQDADGDNVVVTLSKPLLNATNANTIFAFAPGTVDGSNASKQQLTKIDLTSLGAAASGLNITTAATKSALTGGDGFAAVGIIDATGIDLGQVRIDGDLAKITAGDAATATSGLKGLFAESLGRMLFATGAVFPDLHTVIQGKLDFVSIKRDVFGADIDVQGGADGKIGSVFVGGSLIGLEADNSARIQSSGDMGPVRILGNIEGGTKAATGQIASLGKLAGVFVGGSIIGGSGSGAGSIGSSGDMGVITVRGDLRGGSGTNSAQITSLARLAGLNVGGSLIGGSGSSSAQVIALGDFGPINILGSVIGGLTGGSGAVGAGGNMPSIRIGGSLVGGNGAAVTSGFILAQGNLGSVTIGGNVVGGSAAGTDILTNSGCIQGKRIASVTIGGSLIAGRDTTSGDFRSNGAILAGDDIGTVLIKGNLVGNVTNPALIGARGQAIPTATTDVAISKITVLGRVEFANILAGFDLNLQPVNADAQIGSITVGGDWMASNVVAGVFPTNAFFGDGDDVKIAGGKDVAGLSSKVASVTIAGQALGSGIPGDHFGIVAENVGAVKIGGTPLVLTLGNSNDDFFVGITGDFKVNEV